MREERRAFSRQPERARVFILRLWREAPAEREIPTVWRISLQDATTHIRRGFASLEEFFIYLEETCSDEEER